MGETNLPYAYQYIEDFNPSWDINDIDIHCTHADLDLKALQIDYDYFLPDIYARRLYHNMHDQNRRGKLKKTFLLKSFKSLDNSTAQKLLIQFYEEKQIDRLQEYLGKMHQNEEITEVIGETTFARS